MRTSDSVAAAGQTAPPGSAERARRAVLQLAARAVHRVGLLPSLEVTAFDVPVRDLPATLHEATVAQVSDLHVGPGAWVPAHWQRAAAAVRAGRPDLVVATGDFLQWEPPPEKARRIFEPFLGGTADHGFPEHVAILGNHDYYAGEAIVDALVCELQGEGVQVLTNQAKAVRLRGGELTLIGLTGYRPGLEPAIATLAGLPRPRIVLVHEPDLAVRLPAGSADLVLAGHTHGGQLTLPGLQPFIVRRFCGSDFPEGWFTVNDNPMYVNRGLGMTGYPIRFRARPEVTFLRLVPAAR